MSQTTRDVRKQRGFINQLLSAVTVLALGLGFVGLTASAANAALPTGITQASIVKPGPDPATEVKPGESLAQGTPLQLRVSYDLGAKGSVVDFKLGATANMSNLTSLNNNAIASYEIVGGDTVRVTFKDAAD